MALLKAISLLLLADAVQPADISPRIVGGSDVSIEYFPSVVQVDFLVGIFWSQSCAGVILNSRHILSVATCFRGPLYRPNFRRVRAGSADRNSGGEVQLVEASINHPDFKDDGHDSDIAVVRLANPLTYAPSVQQASIAASGTVVPDGIPVIQVGWGASVGELATSILQQVEVYTVNNAQCASAYQGIGDVTANMICTGVAAGGRGACDRDIGGPAYVKDSSGTLVVVGLNSWQRGCGDRSFPSVNTAVAPFTHWVVDTVG